MNAGVFADNEMDMTNASCREFASALASSDPAPGGGGAAALIGALAASLGAMVASLTVGKKKYLDVEERMREMRAECEGLKEELLSQVEADERGFLPLAAAYSFPKEDPMRQSVIDDASLGALAAPLRIMELAYEVVSVSGELAKKGSRLAVSDAGCAAEAALASMRCASLNVFINTRCLSDRERAKEINGRCLDLLERGKREAESVFDAVLSGLLN